MPNSLILGCAFIFFLVFCVILLIYHYNSVIRMREQGEGQLSTIKAYEKKAAESLAKASLVIHQFLMHEHLVSSEQEKTENNMVSGKTLKTSKELKHEIERHPELQSSKEIVKLLERIEYNEEQIAHLKQTYNGIVAEYNTKKAQFPMNLLTKNLKPLEYYVEAEITLDAEQILNDLLRQDKQRIGGNE